MTKQTATEKAAQPIGIFDSGIGGLTVAHALMDLLPHENIIYFGDTAHLPYGDKSASTIQAYSVKIAHMLLQQKCKLILIACNSASAAAYELVKEYVASKSIVMNVIDPTIRLIRDDYAHRTLGLIGTRQTVNSNIYKKKIDELNKGIELHSVSTNLLASAIEEFGNGKAIDSLLTEYLSHPALTEISALILACTHYPVVKEKIAAFFNGKVDIVDASTVVAHAVKHRLQQEGLINETGHHSIKLFYVSDYTESFYTGAKIFFKEEIKLELYPLWE